MNLPPASHGNSALPGRPEALQTPTLLVHLDRVRHNLATMQRWLAGDLRRWRPHTKTTKIPAVLALVVQAGVRRFKCATTRELEVLLQVAAEVVPADGLDVLLAMSVQGPNLLRLQQLAAAWPAHRLAGLSEDPMHAAQLAAAGLSVFVDLDPGYHRSGVPLGEVERIAAVAAAAGARLRGLHCYDGHLHQPPTARYAAAAAIYTQLVALARELRFTGELCTSGTPTFPAGLSFEGFRGLDHTVGAGTVVYWDRRSEGLGIDGFRCAVEVQATVVARPTSRHFTLDAGSKALDAAAGDPCAALADGFAAVAQRPSEEHLPMIAADGVVAPSLGSVLRLVPTHVCPTVNLADEAVLLDGGNVVAVVPVQARGHETWAG